MRMFNRPRQNLIFSQVWESSEEFVEDYKDCELYNENITDASLTKLFFLIYANHGNDSIGYMDVNQWRYKVFSIIHNKGVKWQKALAIQQELESMTDDDITLGSKSITNYSENPSAEALGGTMDEDGLTTINNQGVNITRINKIISYQQYLRSLQDVTSSFIAEFDSLFAKVVHGARHVYYSDEEEEE